MPSASARLAWIASRCGPIFGRSRMTTTSTFSTARPRRAHEGDDVRQQHDARRALPARVGVGIVLADVAGPGGAEDRVGHRVADDVGIGVPERATLGRHGHAAEHERPAFDQPVQVVADADRPGRPPAARAPRRAGEIRRGRDLHVRRVAATTCTRCPARSASMASSVAATRGRPSVNRGRPARRGGTPAASAPEKSPRAGASRRSPSSRPRA